MEILVAAVIAVMTSCGVYLMLRSRTFPVIVGLTLLSYAVNLFIFVMGRLSTGNPAVIGSGESYPDPVPQALVLTAIVKASP
jgi:multicomponent K+:H+ antiporter subunit C